MKSDNLTKKLIQYEVILPFLLLFFIGSLVYMAAGYESRSAKLPLIIGSLTLALILLEIGLRLFAVKKLHHKAKTDVDLKIEALKQGLDGADKEAPQIRRNRLLTAVASMIFYIVFVNVLGYVVTSLVMSAVLVRLLGYRRYAINAIFSLIFVGGTYMVFGYVLAIDLPLGIVFEPFFGD